MSFPRGLSSRGVAEAACMEHQVLDHVKAALRVTLQWHAPAFGLSRKLASVQFTTKAFIRHLLRLMELEEQDGYMAVVRDEKPHLESRVTMLERQHAGFRREVEELRPDLAALPAMPPDQSERLCSRIVALLDQVEQHDMEEIELLQETLLSDEGGEG